MQAATSTAPGGAHHHAAAVARHRSASIRTSSGAVEGRYGIGRHIAQRLVFGVWVAVAVEGCEVTGAQDGLVRDEAVETKYSPLSDHQKAEFAGYASADGLFD